MKIRFGLRIKSIIIVILLVILVSLSVSSLIIYQETELINEQYRAKGVALGRNLSYNSEYGVLTGNYRILEKLVEDLIKQPDVVYCAIRDRTGEILAMKKKEGFRPGFPPIDRETAALPGISKAAVKRLNENGSDYFDISLPVLGMEEAAVMDEEQLFMTQDEWVARSKEESLKGGLREKIGVVNVGISLRGAKEITQQHQRTVAHMVFLLILALSIISGVGITIILVPIRRMVEAIRNIARGDLSTKVDIRSKDELGVLADSFNSMSEELQKTTVSRDYLDNILRSMTDAMIIFSPEGRIISVNKATRDILGYDKSEIIGKDVQSLFSKHTVSKLGLMGKGFAKFIRENPTGPYEVTFLTKNNDRVPVLFSASDVYGKNGKLEEIVGVGKDISKLRESQEELRRLNEQLKRNEQAVLNILSDLKKSHEELKASQEKLVQTEKLASLGRLVSDMAHEVNNPLQIISGRAQISLMEKIQNTEVEESLDIIMDQCERARDIIQRLLLFSKPSKGEIKEIGINDAIEFVAKLLEHQFLLAGVKIIRDYEGGLPPLKLDEKQIHEVFMNLMRNSADAMKGGGTITIRTTREGDKVRTDVTDTGGGIADEDLNKLFDPFFTTKEHGTGLGLSVCYGIIKAHGGELTYSSKLGTGTTATILLPVK